MVPRNGSGSDRPGWDEGCERWMASSLVPLSAASLQVRRAAGTVLRHLDTALQGDVLQIVLSDGINLLWRTVPEHAWRSKRCWITG